LVNTATVKKISSDAWLWLLLVTSPYAIRIRRRYPLAWRFLSYLASKLRHNTRQQDVGQLPNQVAIGQVALDMRLVGKQLRNDLKDDWFPDPLSYGDMLEGDVLTQLIRANLAANDGRYSPSHRNVFNIPKTGFTLRYALETSLQDRALYHGIGSTLLPLYDKLIPWNSFSHRFDYEKTRSSNRYTFKNGIESWKNFIGATRSAISPSSYLVSTDVANFFEHIQLERLRERMKELASQITTSPDLLKKIDAHCSLLFDCLVNWSYEKERGLPQNRDTSSFLANIFMQDLDLSMIERGYGDRYFRYMDDIKIVCANEFDARRAIKDVSIELRRLGLTLNSRKTVIVPASDVQQIDKCLDEGSAAIQQIDELWRRKTRLAIFRLWPILRDRTLALIARGEVDSREFRYCIRRIALLARFRDLHFPKELYAPVTSAICQAAISHPATTDQYVQYLASVQVEADELGVLIDYLSDAKKSIYTWQNYRLWLLFAEKKIVTDSLVKAAVAAIGLEDSPARAGASLYLGATGSNAERAMIAARFPEVTSFIGQRTALIAIHELRYTDVKDLLQTLRPDLKGVFRALGRKESKGTYYQKREEVTIQLATSEEGSYE
jgi:hypothetical protein